MPHEHLSPLQQVQRDFENFKVETPQTAKFERVFIFHEVMFKKACREEANETLTIHHVTHDMIDGETQYLMLQEVVDGPVTDGSRIQQVNDCEIKTYVRMSDASDMARTLPSPTQTQSSTNIQTPTKTQSQTQTPKSINSTSPVTAAATEAGCRSCGSSFILIALILALISLKHITRFKTSF